MMGFADKGGICKFRSFSQEDENTEVELPFWLEREKSAFENMEEVEKFVEGLKDPILRLISLADVEPLESSHR
jgi:hypothetical protein